jgi:hypothetical protein
MAALRGDISFRYLKQFFLVEIIIAWFQSINFNATLPIKLQKGCLRLAAASDKVYQLLAHGRWFSPGTPASSTTKTGRPDIAEILLKVALSTINQIISYHI